VNGEAAKLGEIPYQVHINVYYENTHKNTSTYKIFIYISYQIYKYFPSCN